MMFTFNPITADYFKKEKHSKALLWQKGLR